VPPSTSNQVHRTRDLYALLGVDAGATTGEITAAFRARAKEMHPDRAPEDPRTAEEFKELSRAYATLRRPRSRAAYDARRRTPPATPRPAPARPSRRSEILSTRGRARWAVGGGIACIAAGAAIAPVLLSLPGGPDTIGRDVTLWLVVAKLVVCGLILVGAGWWRLISLGRDPTPRAVATQR